MPMDDYGTALPAVSTKEIQARLDEGGERMTRIENDIAQVRKELHQLLELQDQLADVLEFFNAMRGAFKVLNWLGKLAKPVAYIVMLGTACFGLWTAVRAGGGVR